VEFHRRFARQEFRRLSEHQSTLDKGPAVESYTNQFFLKEQAHMHGRLFLGLAILTMAISIGCGGGGGPRNASRHVAAGELAISPCTLDFGRVAVGTHRGVTGTLTAGDSSIRVTSADWSGEGYSVSGIVFPLTIRAGQSVPFKVIFAPARAGSSAGKVSFQSDAENVTQAAFTASGTQTASHSVTLSWRPAAAEVAGYNVYRGAAPKGPYARINTAPHPRATFTDAAVAGGQTYSYMTTAVSKNGRESKYSNRVQVTIPNS
jgi:hypothetical protein